MNWKKMSTIMNYTLPIMTALVIVGFWCSGSTFERGPVLRDWYVGWCFAIFMTGLLSCVAGIE